MTTTNNDPLIGTRYDGRYLVERRIGNGGMANVYLASDETLGRGVAIKVLHQRYAEDSQFIERFLREASAAARLNHPNIVQVYDRGQSDGSYYIAMEYVDGMTLKDLIRRRGALTEQEVFAYGRQALHALRFAHRNGIVHRDVKPHNMMVDTDGRLKIADFGIARAGSDTGLTEAGSIVGTAQYLSPEQARGLEVSASSDLYSLGVVMFEMSTGRVPFDGDAPVGVALKHVNDPVPSPRQLNANISPAIESIILKAMEKDPARRYGSADEMLADLDIARDGGTTSAMTAVLGGAAIGASAGRMTSATTVTPAAARAAYTQTPLAPEPAWPDVMDEDEEDDAARKRRRRWLIAGLALLAVVAVGALWFLLRPAGDPVPDVVGDTVAEARVELTEAGFRVGEVTEAFDRDASKGEVISQSPDGGEEAESDTPIDLVVSRGAEPIEVPSVVGKPRAVAIEEIEAAGLPTPRVGPPVFDETVKAGVVVSTNPPAGREVAPDTVIMLTLSKGVEDVDVPTVIGLSEEEATTLLEEAGFKVESVDSDSAEEQGTVLSQDPAAGDPLEKDGTVTITVASGFNTVPDLTGLSKDAAIGELEDAGFLAEPSEQENPDLGPGNDDIVVGEQDPSSGQLIEVGSTVSFVVFVPAAEEPAPIEPAPVCDPAVDPTCDPTTT